jgi:hypothetical protein
VWSWCGVLRAPTCHAATGLWTTNVAETVRDIALALSLEGTFHQQAADQCIALDSYLGELYRAIDATKAFEHKRVRRFQHGVPDAKREWIENQGRSSFAELR